MNYVIIGATSAVAIACIKKWAVSGGNFYLVGRSKVKLIELTKELSLSYPQAVFNYIVSSLSGDEEINRVLSINTYCDDDISFLVAQGYFPDHESTINDISITRHVFEVNALNIAFFLQKLVSCFNNNKKITVTVIGSISGDVIRKSDYVYASSKSMINHFVGGLAKALGNNNFRIYLVKLGPTKTNMLRKKSVRLMPVLTPEIAAVKIINLHNKKSGIYYVPNFWKYGLFFYIALKSFF